MGPDDNFPADGGDCAFGSRSANTESSSDGSVGLSGAPRRVPSVAVVFCTRARADSLTKTLDSIWRQTQLPDELLVIDDDALPDSLLHAWAVRCHDLGIVWKYHRKGQPGLPRSRNLAARKANSDVLLYLDDDVDCDTRLVFEMGRLFRDPLTTAATARVREPAFERLGAWMWQQGYKLAGWWRVRPQARPESPRPAALSRPELARPARWLSGAAMALRREVVLANPFDESLGEYALGEDREMGYRLSARYWLVEARWAQVVHRRDPGGRGDPRRYGRMTVEHYVRILRKTCHLRIGDWLLLGWSLAVVAAMHVLGAVIGDRRRHGLELLGMAEGTAGLGWAWMKEKLGATAGRLPLPLRERAGVRVTSADSEGVFDNGISSSSEVRGKGFPQERVRERILAPAMREGILAPATALASARGSDSIALNALFVTNRLEHGGAERMLISLVNHLPAHGIRPYVACLKDAGPLAGECTAAGVEVFANLLAHKIDAGVIGRLEHLIDARHIDVIVAAHSGGDRMFWSSLAGRKSRIPVIVWSHWFPQPGRRHFERANQALYRQVSMFIALGARHRQAMIRYECVPAGRIRIVRNGLDLSRYPGPAARPAARKSLGLDESEPAIGIIANLRAEKRHDVFIRAAAHVLKRHPAARFFIIGDGPRRTQIVTDLVAWNLPEPQVTLLGGRSDVPELLSGLDIVCLCSEIECFSMVMLEAAASGCAFIAPDVGGLGEFLRHGVTGWTIKPSDACSLADAMDELLAAPALRARLASEASRRLHRGFLIEETARCFAEVLRETGKKSNRKTTNRSATSQINGPQAPSGLAES